VVDAESGFAETEAERSAHLTARDSN
jgi:hypothetical protein